MIGILLSRCIQSRFYWGSHRDHSPLTTIRKEMHVILSRGGGAKFQNQIKGFLPGRRGIVKLTFLMDQF